MSLSPLTKTHLTVAGCLHVFLLLSLMKLLTWAIPISSHHSTNSLPASFPLPSPYFPHNPLLAPPLPTLALKSSPPPSIISLPLLAIAICLSMTRLHLSAGTLLPISTLPPLRIPLFYQCTSAVLLPPTFPALSPLALFPPFYHETTLPSPRLPSTKPLPPYLPSVMSTTPSPTSPASPFQPHFSVFSFWFPCTQPPHVPQYHHQQRHQPLKCPSLCLL